MKKKREKPKVIRYHPYYEAVFKNNIAQVKDRVILITAKEEIEKFEQELKQKNLKFIREKRGGYYHYWIIF